LWMSECEMKRAVAAHGNAGDGAIGAAGTDAVVVLDKREKLLEKEILVADFAVAGIDVEAGFAGRSGDEEILEAVFFAEVFDEVPAAGVEESLLVVAEAVEEIQDGETAGFVGVKAGGKENAIGNGAREDSAGDGVALDAAGGGVRTREVKKVEESEREKEKADPSLRSG
jgi:hypothetical protein